jgi:hypothetical protein
MLRMVPSAKADYIKEVDVLLRDHRYCEDSFEGPPTYPLVSNLSSRVGLCNCFDPITNWRLLCARVLDYRTCLQPMGERWLVSFPSKVIFYLVSR